MLPESDEVVNLLAEAIIKVASSRWQIGILANSNSLLYRWFFLCANRRRSSEGKSHWMQIGTIIDEESEFHWFRAIRQRKRELNLFSSTDFKRQRLWTKVHHHASAKLDWAELQRATARIDQSSWTRQEILRLRMVSQRSKHNFKVWSCRRAAQKKDSDQDWQTSNQ